MEKYAAKSICKDSPLLATEVFTVPVDYRAPFSLEDFRAEFTGKVSTLMFDGRTLHKHTLCVGMDETPGNRQMRLIRIIHRVQSTQYPDPAIITKLHSDLRARPATALEARAFAKAQPEAQLEFDSIYAIGDCMIEDGQKYCAWLEGLYNDEPPHTRIFVRDRLDRLEDPKGWFLFVLEEK